ncbi:ABC transporter transmembrane domain-containing protein [Mumia zhuanghuii]|uniref:ABC transporter ATP-binding protein n=2 Tax=Mumia zhuanghuii TaxID=2585211 RepID=A0A5C4N1S4_9ACTN|nr:ABC transporter ATP-binding protein [Mumia zhuanghuii]TNC50254.1 ABC transporter ATP-binding protein [Mumia zhuanghuii]
MADGVALTGGAIMRRMVRRNAGRLSASFALLCVWQLCEALVPILIGTIIDRAIAPSDTAAFVVGAAGLCLLMGTLSYSYRFGARMAFRVVQREEHALRMEIVGHVLHPRGARTGMLPGETLSIATGDAQAATLVVRWIGFTVSSTVVLLASAAYLVSIDVVLGVVVLVGVPVAVGLSQVISPFLARRFGTEQQAVAEASGMATDLVQGIRPLKGIGAERAASARYRTSSRAAERAAVGTVRGWGAMGATTKALSGVLLAAVALVAGLRALDGELTLGQFVAVVGLTQFLAEPVELVAHIGAQFATSYASAKRVAAFLATPRLVPPGTGVPTDPYVLELVGVAAGPLQHVDLRAAPGELVGVVVDDPAASDTLLDLLAAEADPEVGFVMLSGTPLTGLDPDARREVLLTARHQVDLFDGTLATNIDPNGELGDEHVRALLEAVAADDLVATHPAGLARPVQVDGALSGGQRQRLALARALAADVPVLVLQDPTSAVDAVTEQQIATRLDDYRHREGSTQTTVVLTSSPALLARAHRVVVVVDGRTVASGRHADLLERTDYRELVLR